MSTGWNAGPIDRACGVQIVLLYCLTLPPPLWLVSSPSTSAQPMNINMRTSPTLNLRGNHLCALPARRRHAAQGSRCRGGLVAVQLGSGQARLLSHLTLFELARWLQYLLATAAKPTELVCAPARPACCAAQQRRSMACGLPVPQRVPVRLVGCFTRTQCCARAARPLDACTPQCDGGVMPGAAGRCECNERRGARGNALGGTKSARRRPLDLPCGDKITRTNQRIRRRAKNRTEKAVD
jgi:hypothetical protein